VRWSLWRWGLLLSLLALAACGGGSTAASFPLSSPVPAGFVLFTSPDQTYRIVYPSGWQPKTGATVAFLGPAGQYFEVAHGDQPAGSTDLIETVNELCQQIQPDIAASPVQTSVVRLAGQQWTRGDCDAGTQSTVELIVEAVLYQAAIYHLAYISSLAQFQHDDEAFYVPMEQSFTFLR
jgi:hypothetical protein